MNREHLKVLIIDGELINSEYLKQVLLKLGYRDILVATNANEAIDIVNSQHIDFAFIDINIDGYVNGIACAKLINQKYFLPVVYTTAYADSKTINTAIETNMYGYLIKPFDEKDVEVVCNIVQKTALNQDVNAVRCNHVVNICQNHKFDMNSKTLTINNVVVKLSKNELKMLEILCKNINQCVSYDLIKDYVWENKSIADSTMRDTISRLRRRVTDIDIESFSGLGYCLKQY